MNRALGQVMVAVEPWSPVNVPGNHVEQQPVSEPNLLEGFLEMAPSLMAASVRLVRQDPPQDVLVPAVHSLKVMTMLTCTLC